MILRGYDFEWKDIVKVGIMFSTNALLNERGFLVAVGNEVFIIEELSAYESYNLILYYLSVYGNLSLNHPKYPVNLLIIIQK